MPDHGPGTSDSGRGKVSALGSIGRLERACVSRVNLHFRRCDWDGFRAWFDSAGGAESVFTFPYIAHDGTTTNFTARMDNTLEGTASTIQQFTTNVILSEVPTSFPTYAVASTVTFLPGPRIRAYSSSPWCIHNLGKPSVIGWFSRTAT